MPKVFIAAFSRPGTGQIVRRKDTIAANVFYVRKDRDDYFFQLPKLVFHVSDNINVMDGDYSSFQNGVFIIDIKVTLWSYLSSLK